MKNKKCFLVVFIYLAIILAFFLSLEFITNLFNEKNSADSLPIFHWVLYPIDSITYIVYIILGFSIIVNIISLSLFFKYRKQNKKGLTRGFGITSIISAIGFLYFILELLFS
jgi:hypothetical protein